jgi:hypothetical protein
MNQKTLKATFPSPQHISRLPSWTGGDRSARQSSSGRTAVSAAAPSNTSGKVTIPNSPSVEDYSDLGLGEDENGLESKLADMKVSSRICARGARDLIGS